MGSENNITTRRALLAGGAAVAFGSVVAHVASTSGSDETEYVPSSFHASEETTGFGVDLTGRPIAGVRNARVDMYYWTDYLCPFCKRFEEETLPRIGTDYVDAGEVRLVLLSFPNIGDYSLPAAVWGRCVWEQVAADRPAAFWDWHRSVFERQDEPGTGWADEETFAEITADVDGVDVTAVQECRDGRGDELERAATSDREVARAAGIQGTPGFVFYNRESGAATQVVGAQPYGNFRDAIERVRDA